MILNLKNKLIKKDNKLIAMNNVKFIIIQQFLKKSNNPLEEKENIICEVIPILYNMNYTKFKDLRTNKIYIINKAQNGKLYFYQTFNELIQDYKIVVDLNNKNIDTYGNFFLIPNSTILMPQSFLSLQAYKIWFDLINNDTNIIASQNCIVEIADAIKKYKYIEFKNEEIKKLANKKKTELIKEIDKNTREF